MPRQAVAWFQGEGPPGRLRASTGPTVSAVLGTLLGLVVAAPALAQVEGVDGVTAGVSVDEAEQVVQRAEEQLSTNQAEAIRAAPIPEPNRPGGLEQALVHGELFFELGKWDQAAVLLWQALEDPRLSHSAERGRVAWMLARSLRRAGSPRAALRLLRPELTAGSPNLTQLAAEFLEAALDTRGKQDLSSALRAVEALPASVRGSSRIQYAIARILYRLGQRTQAARRFGSIPSGTPEYPWARYYLGVLATAAKDYATATERFEEVLAATRAQAARHGEATPERGVRAASGSERSLDRDARERNAASDELRLLRDQAWMALARLRAATGDLRGAVEAYQHIRRQSPLFEDALYELAWTWAGAGIFEEALHAVDVLLLLSSDPGRQADAGAFRGRILQEMGRLDEAASTLESVVERFTPLSRELADLARSPTRLSSYFEAILEGRLEDIDAMLPLSDQARALLNRSPAFRPAVRVLSLVGRQRREIEDLADTLTRLRDALSSSQTLLAFADLRSRWLSLMEAENSLLVMQGRVLNELGRHLGPTLADIEAARYEAARARRLALQEAFARNVPLTAVAWHEQARRIAQRLDKLDQELALTVQVWRATQRQLGMLRRWLQQARQGTWGPVLTPERERRAQAAIDEMSGELRQLRDRIGALRREVQLEYARASGDALPAGGSARDLKTALVRAQRREYEILLGVQGSNDEKTARLAELAHRILRDLARAAEETASVQSEAQRRVARMRVIVDEEAAHVQQYRKEAQRLARQGREVVQRWGRPLFELARRDVEHTVLEADVGLLDIAWARHSQAADRAARVDADCQGKLDEVDRILEDVLGRLPSAASSSQPGAPTGATHAPGTPSGPRRSGGASAQPSGRASAPGERQGSEP